MYSLYATYYDNPAGRHGIRVLGDLTNLIEVLAVFQLSDRFVKIEIRDLDAGLIRGWDEEQGFYFKE